MLIKAAVMMKAATLTVLAIIVGMCNMKYYLIETRDGSHIKSDTGDVEYGYNYNDYYGDYQAGMCIAFTCGKTCPNNFYITH